MRLQCTALAASLLLGLATSATAAPPPGAPARSLAALVKVDADGGIGSVLPSHELPPALQRQLQQDLQQALAADASHAATGPHQLLAEVARLTTPLADGQHTASFRLESTRPVPAGQWYWEHTDKRRVRLVNRERGFAPGRQAPGLRDPLQHQPGGGVPVPPSAPPAPPRGNAGA